MTTKGNLGTMAVGAALLGAVLTVSLASTGCERAPAQGPKPPPKQVTVSCPIERTVTDYADFTGQTMAVGTVEIRARVWGYLQKVNFKEGGLVNKGDLLFVIDPRPYEAALQQSQGKVAQDEAQLKNFAAVFQRITELGQRGAATRDQLDKAQADRDTAAATLQADRGDLAQRQLDLDHTRITAPISGRMSRAEVTEGNMVQSGQNGGTLLTTLVSVDPIYVYFDVDERTLLQVRRMINQGSIKSVPETAVPMFIGLADEEGFPHSGTIDFMDNRVDPSTGTLRLRAVFSNGDGLLSPGLFVRCRLPIGSPHRSILVAEQSLGSDQGQKYVFVVNEKNEVVYRAVKTGRLYEGRRVIESGLSLTDKVIVNGLQRVRPGDDKIEAKQIEMPGGPAVTKAPVRPVKPSAGS